MDTPLPLAPPGPPATARVWDHREDLTARARIREAALDLLGEQGVAGTSIRAVAQRAGVSSGLVQHHFGTKDHLRRACDIYVLQRLALLREGLAEEGGTRPDRGERPDIWAVADPDMARFSRYLARSLVDGTPGAADVFDEMVRATDAWLSARHPGAFPDQHGVAALVVAMESGALAVHHLLSAALGVDVLSPEGSLRVARLKVDLYATPLLDDDGSHRAMAEATPAPGTSAP